MKIVKASADWIVDLFSFYFVLNMLPHLKTTTVTLEYQVSLGVSGVYNSRTRSYMLQALNDAVPFV